MDRYEYNVKSDQIKKLYGKKEYEPAAEIADEIDWSRVKNNGMLAMVADIYEGTKQYDKARDVLEIAYERSPLGRQLAYRLTIISLRMRDFVAADEYYQDFVELAPRDVAQYILKYRIARAKGEDLSVLISILEAYVDVEMDERWQYELAKLYHEAEQTDKCVEMCDKIILWFSEGKYVTKAMELKMKHEPLTEEQQAKYDGKWDYYNEKIKTEEMGDSQGEEASEQVTESEEEETTETSGESEEEKAPAEEKERDGWQENPVEEKGAEEGAESDGETKEEKWPQPDLLNDTTALDYLTDYSEEEKIIKEPEVSEVDEETALEVEQQIAKIVEESVESARSEMEERAEAEDTEVEEVFEEEEIEEEEIEEESVSEETEAIEEDSVFGEEKQDIEDMDDTELVAEAYASEEESVQEEETEEDYEEDDKKEDEEIVMESDDRMEEEEMQKEETEGQFQPESKFSPENKIEIFEFDESKSGKMKNIGEELMKTAEIDIDEINLQVDSSDSAVYDTANIQEALAKSMKLILQAESEKATRNAFAESEVMDEPTKRIDKEDVPKQPEHKKPVYETVPLQPIYDKEEDGQIKIFQPVEAEEQIDGQMNMEDVLLEFEKQKREALEEAARREEEAREAARRAAQEAAAARAAVEKALAEEAAARAALEKAAKTQQFLQKDNILQNFKESSMEPEESVYIPEPEQQPEEGDMVQETEYQTEETTTGVQQMEHAEFEEEYHVDIEAAETGQETEEGQEEKSEEQKEEMNPKLSDEDKKMFVDFLDIMGLEEQIAATLDNLVNHFVKDGTSKTNNVMVMGDAKSGKTTLALGIIKAANRGRGRNGRKVAKVKATALNKKGISAAMSQILGTDLIIEQAGNLMPGTVVDLIAAMKAYTEEMIIVLEDDKAALERLVTANPVLEEIFNNQISIKEFEINDFVKIAKDYAESKQYVIDEMGTLALYAKIDDISGKNQGISRSDIYEIIDKAILHAERFKISKLIGKIKRTHYEMGVLKEEDFN